MRTLIVLSVILVAGTSCAEDPKTRFERLEQQYLVDTGTDIGYRYEDKLLAANNRFWKEMYASCRVAPEQAGITNFKGITIINAKGRVEEFVTWPVYDELDCFITTIEQQTYPAPPFAPFHGFIQVLIPKIEKN